MGKINDISCEDNGKVSFFNRIVLWKGVIRRFLLYIFNKKYINKKHKERKGQCIRCGACCKLAVKKCMYLEIDTNKIYFCKHHKSFRMPNCVIFPIDNKDIKDRNIITKEPCGYYFE